MKILRRTKSVCPKCINEINAEIIEENNKIFMKKKCDKHGLFKIKLFSDSKYYKELSDFYYSFDVRKNKGLIPKKQEYYNMFLTMKCNLDCPICHVNANSNLPHNLSKQFIRMQLKKINNARIGLFGGEATLRRDLIEIIKIVKETGNLPVLHTNGIKITDYNYLKKIKEAGVIETHLQYDGLNDKVYKKIRGKKLKLVKIKSLENLRKLNIPTIIQFTIAKNENEKDMQQIFNYALKNNFIKAILFKSYSHLGKAGLNLKKTITIDEQIKYIKEFKKKEIIQFGKLLYLFWNLLSFHRCFYNHYFLISRKNGKMEKISEIIDLNKINSKLNIAKDLKDKKSKFYNIYLFLSILPSLINRKSIPILFLSAITYIKRKIIKEYFVFGTTNKDLLVIEFGAICDMYNFDFEYAKNCDGGEITTEGINNSLAYGNVLREKIKRKTNV